MDELKILVIEDDDSLQILLAEYLLHKGCEVDISGDGVTGLHLAVVNDYDVLILDLTLPGIDGLDVCNKLRNEAKKRTPILMLSGRGSLDDKLAGFGNGADDYLVKPFELDELWVRINALTRRAQQPGDDSQVLQVGELILNLETMVTKRAGKSIDLTSTSLRILEELMRKAPNVVKRGELEKVLRGDNPPDSSSLRTHIHYLREALDKPFAAPMIHTVHGIGYRITSAR